MLIAADSTELEHAAEKFRSFGVNVETVETDLATTEGVEELYEATNGRSVDILMANAGHGLGHAFLEQEFEEARHVIDTNVTGTVYLVHKIGRDMRARSAGKILFTGSIAGFIPGTYRTVYNATKAFIDSFERADMLDAKVGAGKKDDPADVAKVGFKAMMDGKGDVVAGVKNKLSTMAAAVTPSGMLPKNGRTRQCKQINGYRVATGGSCHWKG